MDVDELMAAYDPRSMLVALGRGVRRRAGLFVIWPGIPNPFLWERAGCASASSEACAA